MADQLTEDQIIEFKEAFSVFDKDQDGTITTKELGSVMRSLGQNPTDKELQLIISEIDIDKNGTIEFSEFLLLMVKKIQNIDIKDHLIEAFKIFDIEEEGKINISILRHVMRNIGKKLNEQEVDEMWKQVDCDENGNIDYYKFINSMISK